MSDERREPERRPDGAAFLIAAGLAALGALLLWDAARLPQAGGYGGVGPADVPRMIGYGLIGLGLWTAIAGWRGQFPDRPAQEVGPVVWIVGGLALQLILLPFAGFAIATGLLFACVARGFGKRELWLSIPLGIGFCVIVYGIFDRLLQLNLPTGPLETLIFGA